MMDVVLFYLLLKVLLGKFLLGLLKFLHMLLVLQMLDLWFLQVLLVEMLVGELLLHLVLVWPLQAVNGGRFLVMQLSQLLKGVLVLLVVPMQSL